MGEESHQDEVDVPGRVTQSSDTVIESIDVSEHSLEDESVNGRTIKSPNTFVQDFSEEIPELKLSSANQVLHDDNQLLTESETKPNGSMDSSVCDLIQSTKEATSPMKIEEAPSSTAAVIIAKVDQDVCNPPVFAPDATSTTLPKDSMNGLAESIQMPMGKRNNQQLASEVASEKLFPTPQGTGSNRISKSQTTSIEESQAATTKIEYNNNSNEATLSSMRAASSKWFTSAIEADYSQYAHVPIEHYTNEKTISRGFDIGGFTYDDEKHPHRLLAKGLSVNMTEEQIWKLLDSEVGGGGTIHVKIFKDDSITNALIIMSTDTAVQRVLMNRSRVDCDDQPMIIKRYSDNSVRSTSTTRQYKNSTPTRNRQSSRNYSAERHEGGSSNNTSERSNRTPSNSRRATNNGFSSSGKDYRSLIDNSCEVPPDCKLFLGDVYPPITEENLIETFQKYGRIRRVTIVKDKVTSKCKGYAFIYYDTLQGPAAAMEAHRFIQIGPKQNLVELKPFTGLQRDQKRAERRGEAVKRHRPAAPPRSWEEAKAPANGSGRRALIEDRPVRDHEPRDRDRDRGGSGHHTMEAHSRCGGGDRGGDPRYGSRSAGRVPPRLDAPSLSHRVSGGPGPNAWDYNGGGASNYHHPHDNYMRHQAPHNYGGPHEGNHYDSTGGGYVHRGFAPPYNLEYNSPSPDISPPWCGGQDPHVMNRGGNNGNVNANIGNGNRWTNPETQQQQQPSMYNNNSGGNQMYSPDQNQARNFEEDPGRSAQWSMSPPNDNRASNFGYYPDPTINDNNPGSSSGSPAPPWAR